MWDNYNLVLVGHFHRGSKKQSIESLERKLSKAFGDLGKCEVEYKHAKKITLQLSRLVKCFKEILDAPPEGFDDKKNVFIRKLNGSRYKIAGHILDFIKRFGRIIISLIHRSMSRIIN